MKKLQLDTHIHMGCRTNGDGYEYNWQQIDMKNFQAPQNKMFFIFGGNNTNRAEAANGNAKVIERLLSDINRDKVILYSFIYDSEPLDVKTKILTESYEEEIHQIYEKMIQPLFLDRIGNLKDKQGIEKVLKNIVFVSHCGGSYFVNVIIDDIHATLIEKFHPSIADHMISKLQYFSYAPKVLPERIVNSVVVTPFFDVDYSWTKSFDKIKDKRVDVDYPKGATKKILKAKEQGDLSQVFSNIFDNQRIIAFKADQSIYLIPSRINSNIMVGDHSIDCLTKTNVLEADTEFAKTAKILNHASKLVINNFASDLTLDNRTILDKIVNKISNNKPNQELAVDKTCKPEDNGVKL